MPVLRHYRDPMPYSKNNISYVFWIKSNRGTDVAHEVHLPRGMKKDEIVAELEDWCSMFACWEQSSCRYGYRKKKK